MLEEILVYFMRTNNKNNSSKLLSFAVFLSCGALGVWRATLAARELEYIPTIELTVLLFVFRVCMVVVVVIVSPLHVGGDTH